MQNMLFKFFVAEYYGFPMTEIFFFRKGILFPFQWGIAWYWTVNNTRDMIFYSYMAKYIKIICGRWWDLLININVTFPVVPGSESGCYHRNKHLEMFLTVFC